MSAEATIPHEALKEVVSRIESELGHVVCLAVDVLFNTMKDAANRPKEAFQAAKTILRTFRWEKLLGQWERDNRVPISESRLNHLSLMGLDLKQTRRARYPQPPTVSCSPPANHKQTLCHPAASSKPGWRSKLFGNA